MEIVRFSNVAKSYTTRTGTVFSAIKDFDLTIERGEFFCLLGPSGCGKTTILQMLAGFEFPSTGQMMLEGKRIAGPSRDRGVVFQGEDSLYGWLTAAENVEFGLRLKGVPAQARRDAALEYLELVGLPGQQGKYPNELSGGMKQRTQIARALANEPKMLLMDEPFGALDAQTRETMQRELRRIWQATGVSAFFITHDIDEAILLGSRVGVMTAGPGARLKEVIDITFSGERTRADPAYLDYYARIHAVIRGEAERGARRPDREAA